MSPFRPLTCTFVWPPCPPSALQYGPYERVSDQIVPNEKHETRICGRFPGGNSRAVRWLRSRLEHAPLLTLTGTVATSLAF